MSSIFSSLIVLLRLCVLCVCACVCKRLFFFPFWSLNESQSHFIGPQGHAVRCHRTIALLCRAPRIYFLIIITPELFVNMSGCLPSCMPLAHFYFRSDHLSSFSSPFPPSWKAPHPEWPTALLIQYICKSDVDLLGKDTHSVCFIGQSRILEKRKSERQFG